MKLTAIQMNMLRQIRDKAGLDYRGSEFRTTTSLRRRGLIQFSDEPGRMYSPTDAGLKRLTEEA